MKLKELKELLNKIEDDEKDVYFSLHSPYGNEYDLSTDNIKVVEDTHDVELIGE